MKLISYFVLFLLFASCTTSQQLTQVPSNQAVSIELPVNKNLEVDLNNKSLKQVEVKVINPNTGEFVSGFGLGAKGKATVFVGKGNTLQLKGNNSKVAYTYRSVTPPQEITNPEKFIDFTLANASAKSIPLIIPSVMNPNLSPYSKSGVSLKPGQKIFFKQGGKRYLLLEVSNSIAEGSVIEVAKLLKERKTELGL